jgi:diguanylate cyclase (GGDEF)-like protein
VAFVAVIDGTDETSAVQRLADEVARSRRMQDVLRDIEQSIGAEVSTAATLDQVAEGARRLFGPVLSCVVIAFEDGSLEMVAASPRSFDSGFMLPARVPRATLAPVFRDGETIRVDDYQALPVEARAPMFDAIGLTAVLAVPIRRGADVVGCLVVAATHAGASFAAEDERSLSFLADHAAISLAHGEVLDALARTVAKLERRARTDVLTGLLNRHGFFEALDRRLADPEGLDCSLVFIDLDRFKAINDLHGHAAGDQVLVTVADRLAAVEGVELPSRLAGDEFVAIISGDDHSVVQVAERLLADLAAPIGSQGAAFELTASVGVARVSSTMSSSELLTNADLAMLKAKLLGRGRVARFDQGLRLDMARRSAREWRLTTAIGGGEFVVRYQTIVDLRSGEVVGIEALVRWDHPVEGVLGPDQFLELAEDLGLIGQIDELVMGRAVREIALLRAELPAFSDLRMSVNVSPVSLADSSLPDRIHTVLLESGTAPSLLEVEVTETRVLDGRSGARSVQRIHDLGVRICVDDFGTGWSSLRRLRTLPVGRLKIDRDFVSGVCQERADRAIVRGIVELAETLGLEVVAEGVESGEQMALLRRLGCRLGQGYLFGPPCSVDELRRYLPQTLRPASEMALDADR